MRSRVASPAALRPRDRSSAESRAWGHANNTSRKQHLGGMPRFPPQDSCGKRSSSSRVAAAYRRLHTMNRGEIARVCGGHDVRRMVTPLARYRAPAFPAHDRTDRRRRQSRRVCSRAHQPERTNNRFVGTAVWAFIPSLRPARGSEVGSTNDRCMRRPGRVLRHSSAPGLPCPFLKGGSCTPRASIVRRFERVSSVI